MVRFHRYRVLKRIDRKSSGPIPSWHLLHAGIRVDNGYRGHMRATHVGKQIFHHFDTALEPLHVSFLGIATLDHDRNGRKGRMGCTGYLRGNCMFAGNTKADTIGTLAILLRAITYSEFRGRTTLF